MILYTDSLNAQYTGGIMSPAIRYAHVNDFSNILDEIRTGNLPTNTNQPFDVNYELKQPESSQETPPWMSNTNYVNTLSSCGYNSNPWSTF